MSSDDPAGTGTGHGELRRHIFTSAAAGPHGAGFRTVASAITDLDLHGEIEQALEEASEAAAVERVHQALTLPGRPQLCLLSRLEPAGAAGSALRGNFWAESVLVPRAWLDGGQWDVARAFERIDFPGPRELPAAGGTLTRLEPESLAALSPGPLARLERLRRTGTAQRRCLLQAVVRQSRDRSPVFVVRPDGMDPAEFEQLVLLAPLLLPPGRRTAAGGARPMHLRTLGLAAGSVFSRSIDVLGVTSDQLDEVRRETGTVVDLNPKARSARRRAAGSYGEAYVDWLAEILEDRRWDELERFYATARKGDPIAGFTDVDPRAEALPLAEPQSRRQRRSRGQRSMPSSQPRRPAWQAREQQEENAAALRREIAGDVRQLEAALEEDFARQRAALEQAGAAHLRRLDEVARQRMRDLETAAAPRGSGRPGSRDGRYAAARSRAWINPLLIGLLVVLSVLLAVDLWQTWSGAAPENGGPAPAEIVPPETTRSGATRFDTTRPDKESALGIVRAALISGEAEPSSIWLAWSSASISDPTACALLQMALASAVDSRCGPQTANKLAARIQEFDLGSSTSHEARFFEHLLELESQCVRRPLTLDCLPAVDKTREFTGLANETFQQLEARIANRRQQGKTTARESEIQAELSNLVLNVSPQVLDRLREVPVFLVSPMLELAGELCSGAVADSGDRFDSAALGQCLAALEGRPEAAP